MYITQKLKDNMIGIGAGICLLAGVGYSGNKAPSEEEYQLMLAKHKTKEAVDIARENGADANIALGTIGLTLIGVGFGAHELKKRGYDINF